MPTVRGRVVDENGAPVGGALVQIAPQSGGREIARIRSDAKGIFSRPQESRFTWQFAGADRALRTCSVRASEGGRQSSAVQITDGVRRWFLFFYDPPMDRELATCV